MNLHNCCNSIITSKASPMLKKLWYLLMPSFSIWRTVYNLKIYFDSRDNPFAWFAPRNIIENIEGVGLVIETQPVGRLWDIGCNAGIYSLHAAALGWNVTAVDLSRKATELLLKSKKANRLNLSVITSALTTRPVCYFAPKTSTAGNSIQSAKNGDVAQSITWKDLVRMCGIPTVIKMDIEGAETEFLQDNEFLDWLSENGIVWLLEVHSELARKLILHPRLNARQLSSNNYKITVKSQWEALEFPSHSAPVEHITG